MKTPEQRKNESENFIQKKHIAFLGSLPMLPASNEVTVKSVDVICKRAVASLLSTQISAEIRDNGAERIGFFVDLMKQFGVSDALNPQEKRLLEPNPTAQDILNIEWEYEAYWSLVWALGLVEDITDGGTICDCEKAIMLVAGVKSYDEFKSRCKLRDTEEIMDMLDLYYRYHWATVQHRAVDPKLPIGNLNEEIVMERRRGLQWLISEEDDWFEIAMHT